MPAPFAWAAAKTWRMTDTQRRPRLIRKRKVRPYQGRSAIYAWLRSHHVAIAVLRNSAPCFWAELVLDMVEDGVVDGRGATPTAQNTRMTWQRVQRDVEADPAKTSPIGGKYPSRISPDWRPQPLPPPPALPPPLRAQAQAQAQALVPVPIGSSTAFVAQVDAADLSHLDEVGRARVIAMQESVLGQLFEMDRKKFGQ